MKFFSSALVLFILFSNSHTVTVFASPQFLEETERSSSPKLSTTRPKAKRNTRPKANTFPQANTVTPNIGDQLSYLLDGGGAKKSGSATIGSVTTKKSSSKTFDVPMKLSTEDIIRILQEEEVPLSGRIARLKEFKSSSIIVSKEELKAKKNVHAIFKQKQRDKENNDFERIGEQPTPKVILVEYDVYGGDEKISLDVLLKVAFKRVKKTKNLKE